MPSIDLHNTALIQDEVLMEIVKVVEKGWPAGPSFFCALGSLIEAAVIHDRVFYDPMHQTQRESADINSTLTETLNQSLFVRQLLDEKVLTLFPTWEEIDRHFETAGSSYKSDNFLLDYYYGLESFSSTSPEGPISEFSMYSELIQQAPSVLMTDTLIENEAGDPEVGFISFTRPVFLRCFWGFRGGT